jgi:hypothetical protein
MLQYTFAQPVIGAEVHLHYAFIFAPCALCMLSAGCAHYSASVRTILSSCEEIIDASVCSRFVVVERGIRVFHSIIL